MIAHSALRILVVDDEPNIRTTFARALDLEGFVVDTAADAAEALAAVDAQPPDLILLDLRLPDRDGLWVLEQLQSRPAPPPVVMMSGHGTLDSAVRATRLGALDFLEKPVKVDRLLLTVANVLRLDGLGKDVGALQRAVVQRLGMVGSSAAVGRVIDAVMQAAPTRARVLITGESGVGKELVARAIHDASRRAAGPFVKMNCAAIPESLAESELFGHERGAFTGADRRRLGRFERADGGTLFLDEIGEMPLALQARMLRVLQEGELERVGGSSTVPVDVRVITATNRDLQAEVEAGAFRADLYYRLAVFPLEVPPLRARLGDVPALAIYLLARSVDEHGLPEREWSDGALRALQEHDWPGNIRELGNLVDRLAILAREPLIRAEDVRAALIGVDPAEASPLGPSEGPLQALVEEFERRVIEERIARMDGNMTAAAADLGLERSHLYKKVRRLGIRRDE